ncbi:hypothetical protein [Psychromonas arctica]|uniref:hypothetical protein n=1 Tax=Psychromonas arctica TaxID=168275 RepID=UPI002FCF4625
MIKPFFTIMIDPNNEKSVIEGLHEYKQLLDAGRAFDKELDVDFLNNDNGRLKFSDIPNADVQELVKTALMMSPELEDYEENEDLELPADLVFFAVALSYPRVKKNIIETAESFVYFSRMEGDNLWEEEQPFGIEILYIIARCYEESCSILGKYLTEWCHENTSGYESYAYDLVMIYGWNEYTIKMYICCDVPFFRVGMYWPYVRKMFQSDFKQPNPNDGDPKADKVPTLLNTFKKDQNLYHYFKQELVIQVCRNISEDKEIIDYFKTLSPFWKSNKERLISHIPNTEAILTVIQRDKVSSKIIKSEIDELNNEVLKQKQSGVRSAHRFKNQDNVSNRELLHDLLALLKDGPDIIDYVKNGDSEDYVKRHDNTWVNSLLERIEPIDFISFVKGSSTPFYAVVMKTDSLIDVRTNKDIGEKIIRFIKIVYNSTLDRWSFDFEEIDEALRLLDVLKRLLALESFNSSLYEYLVIKSKSISHQDFYQRYSSNSLSDGTGDNPYLHQIMELIDNLVSYNAVVEQYEPFIKIDTVFDVLPRSAIKLLCLDHKLDETNMGYLNLISAYLVYRDSRENVSDEYTDILISSLQKTTWPLFTKLLRGMFESPEEDYRDVDGLNPENIGFCLGLEIFRKGISSDELEEICLYFENKESHTSEKRVLKLLEQYLIKKDAIVCSQHQPIYRIFNHSVVEHLILSSILLSQNEQAIDERSERFLRLIFQLSPMIVLNSFSTVVELCTNNGYKDYHLFSTLMNKIGISFGDIAAYFISRFYDEKELDDYNFEHIYWAIKALYCSRLDGAKNDEAIKFLRQCEICFDLSDQTIEDFVVQVDIGLTRVDAKIRLWFLTDINSDRVRIDIQEDNELCKSLRLIIENMTYEMAPTKYTEDISRYIYRYMQDNEMDEDSFENLALDYSEHIVFSDSSTVVSKAMLEFEQSNNKYSETVILQRTDSGFKIIARGCNSKLTQYSTYKNVSTENPEINFWPVVINENENCEMLLEFIHILERYGSLNTYIYEKTKAYIKGDFSYRELITIYNKYIIYPGTFNLSYKLGKYHPVQFVWSLNSERRLRFIKLMFDLYKEDAYQFIYAEYDAGPALSIKKVTKFLKKLDIDKAIKSKILIKIKADFEVEKQNMIKRIFRSIFGVIDKLRK